MRVTVYFFHPFPRRSVANRKLLEAIRGVEGIQLRDMYETYPEFFIDVDAEQAILKETDVAVFQHPMYWYNCPSLMKEWLDSVLEHGWAYGPGGTHLRGKYWIQAITTGGPQEAYARSGHNLFTLPELLRPFEQTALLCGMKPLQPFLLNGVRMMNEATATEAALGYRRLIEGLRDGQLPPPYSTVD